MFTVSTILTAAVGKYTQKRYSLGVKKRNDYVIEHVGRDKSVLAVVQFAERYFRIRVDKSLPVYMPDAFNLLGFNSPPFRAVQLISKLRETGRMSEFIHKSHNV
jgi:hypothetical protein